MKTGCDAALMKNADVIYLCDPVLGDNEIMYCPIELIDVYKEQIIPLANVITPNQFEFEKLIGEKNLASVDIVFERMNILHDLGCPVVIISSYEFLNEKGKLYLLFFLHYQ